MIQTLEQIAGKLDQLVRKISVVFAWLNAVLVLVIVLNVVLRYAFNSGFITLEELQWHLYGTIIMIGIAYAQVEDAHVRVDLLHHQLTPKKKAWVEVLGYLFILLPFVYVVFIHSLPFVGDAITHMESSDAPEGLPFRFIIKSMIPFGFGLLFLTASSRFMRDIITLVRPDGN